MSGEHEFERELKGALSVAPSDDFETRVLRRIEADRGTLPARSYAWWLAAAAAAVLTAGGWYLARPAAPEPEVRASIEQRVLPRQAAPVVEPAAPDRPHADVATQYAPRATAIARRSQGGPTDATRMATEPEVLVSGQQLEAVRRLMREVNAGRFVISEPPREVSGALEDVVITPVVIELIAVPTLEVSGGMPAGSKGLQFQ